MTTRIAEQTGYVTQVQKILGDWQTPLTLAQRCVAVLAKSGRRYKNLLEPTCGTGNFIEAALQGGIGITAARGFELQQEYVLEAQLRFKTRPVQVTQADFFTLDLPADVGWKVDKKAPLLILGNPPWVTNAGQAPFTMRNLPAKSNLKQLSGMSAQTGESNFDISEAILIALVAAFYGTETTLAMLCKTGVARELVQYCWKKQLPFSNVQLYEIDARKEFHAAVDACLLIADLHGVSDYQVSLFSELEATTPSYRFGVVGESFVADVKAYQKSSQIEGAATPVWRSGIKHDVAAVVELRKEDGVWKNQLGEDVQVEEEFIYPLLKSSDLQKEKITPVRGLLVPSVNLSADSSEFKKTRPQLYRYLHAHAAYFSKRKSSIYRGKDQYAFFGIGPYSFAPYKVAISGLYHSTQFKLIPPYKGRCVMLDDTCYFLSFPSKAKAEKVLALLNHSLVQTFLQAIIFWDAKRPLSAKRVLNRIDLVKAHQLLQPQTVVGGKGVKETKGLKTTKTPARKKNG